MKKVISFIVVLVLCFSLCSCANSAKEKDFIGIWKGVDAFGEPTTITINDNGTGSWYSERGSKYTFTWEIKGDSIVFNQGGDINVYTINREVSPYELSNGIIDPFVKSN